MDNSKNKLLEKLLEQYKREFNDTLPLPWMGLTVDQAIELVRGCLAKKKPYDLKLPKGAVL